ncbi:MAG: hypothetical protein E2576_11220 [Alcaligenaceae bacterium]|nr:hypothetical protein [Alcaligenaceae bacterium SAGV5]MPS51222.1 hypothetical protein [Alcaligenaceae bacterium SAGV3]MPT57281.1 hypothetical protein [Alcaligenaceae bacterium]
MYTVTLQDYPHLPEELRLQAERRYARTLEKALGGSEGLAAAYKAWNWAEESLDEISDEDRSLALRWQRAATKAAQEGFAALGETDSAYFEVRLER